MTKYLIDENEYVNINGAKLNVRYRSQNIDNPILLFIHGGPGVCDRHWVLKYQSNLSEIATLVCYDQRCAGRSYNKHNLDNLTIDIMVEDAYQLALYLCKKFDKKKVIVIGHSWGSVVGTLLTQKHSEVVECYIGQGQVVNGALNEEISYDFCLNKAKLLKDKKGLKQLESIGRPINGQYKSVKDMNVQRNYLSKYGGGTYNSKESLLSSLIIPLILSPEYKLSELFSYANGAYYSLDQLWTSVVALDFFTTVTKLDVPVFLTLGRHDFNTPVQLSQKWFDQLVCPKKELYYFENSAHSPIKEEPSLWGECIKNIVLSLD